MKKKLVYYENDSIDPYFNLALEEYLLLNHCDEEDIFLLWKNEPTVVVGRHQNTIEEVDVDFAACHGIHVVRRISGGGAVFHDLGNLNYSFLGIDTEELFDFSRFTRPLIHTLARLGLSAENGGRNDVFIDGKKISGNAQFRRHNRVLHHGTILFNTDLNRLSEVLHATSKSYATSGIASVRARVVNVLECLQKSGPDMTLTEFQSRLLDEIHRSTALCRKNLTMQDRHGIEQLRDDKYRTKKWNFGGPPLQWNHCVSQRFDWGTLDVRMSIKDDIVRRCKIFGDFFCLESPDEICRDLVGLRFEPRNFDDRLDEHKLRRVLPELEKTEFIKMLFDTPDPNGML